MTEARYLRIYDMMTLVVLVADLYGGTWDELEQILHDNMKDHDFPLLRGEDDQEVND